MAKGRLVASVVFQELLEELVLPHCESVDIKLEYLATRFGQSVTASRGKSSLRSRFLYGSG